MRIPAIYAPEKKTKWECPEENDARILGGPNLPKPLHGVNPRTFMGVQTWDRLRKRTYYMAKYKCQICGADCSDPGSMDAHELYTIDYEKGTSTFVKTVGICKACVDSETEVLTIDGWKKIPKVTTKDLVACWSPNGRIVFEHPTDTIVSYHKEAIRISGAKGEELLFSPNHRLPLLVSSCRPASGNVVDVLAEDYKPSHYYDWILGGYSEGDETLTDAERIYIAIEADGCIVWDKENLGPRSKNKGVRERKYGGRYGHAEQRFSYIISVKKQRKIDRLKELLPKSGVEYKILGYDKRRYFRVRIWDNRELKHFKNCFDVKMGSQKAKDFIDELMFWDGHAVTKCWYTTKIEEVDFVQSVAAQCNIRTHVVERSEPNKKTSYRVGFCPENNRKSSKLLRPKRIPWNNNMYCISVPTSYFVARRNNFVFVTGNCHNFYHSGRLITLCKKHIPFYSPDVVLTIVEHGFKQIHDWNEANPKEPKLKAYSTFIEYLKHKDLGPKMEELIKKYDIEFWEEDKKQLANWGDWKLIFGKKIYPTPYENYEAWEKAMDKASKNDVVRQIDNPFSGGAFKEIAEIIKEES